MEETFVTYTIAEPCVDIKDKACIEECPVDCIYEGARMLYIHPDECVDCGACEPVCPVEAIFYEDDVPEQWAHYTQINADFFAELGSPGARRKSAWSKTTRRWSRICRRRARATERPGGSPAGCVGDITGIPLGHFGRSQGGCRGASGRHRRPVHRHPVDPVAPAIRGALASASASPGYPMTAGTPRLRQSIVSALGRRYGVTGLSETAVLPVIGTKELIAWLPTLLGFGGADLVVVPELAYPTYEVGARLAGTQVLRADSLTQLGPQSPALVYLNSPSNPTGRVLGIDHLRKVVGWARERGVLVVSDECYLGLGWDTEPLSVLHPSVCDGDHRGLLAVHSLSKSSSLAGYRAGFVAGDAAVVAELLAVRRHAGMMVPTPVQAAMVAALDDDAHEREQRDRYARRRAALLAAFRAAGLASTIPKPGSTCGSRAANRVATPSTG
ncbi:succinyldiaminopimelate transaminase [Mycobacterium xenopi 3993]|nr:succinyldiaminopimelate transaminase [Mycobacterium xenopi 3993]